jgi:hypothetical protein
MPAIPAGIAAGAGAGAAGYEGMSSKQREAYQEQQRFRVHNQGGAGPSGGAPPMSATGTSGSGGPVTVHEDGGALGEDDNGGAGNSEIPPT